MLRFLFGMIIGVVLTLYLQVKGDDILKGIGIDPKAFHSRFKVITHVTQTVFKDEVSEKAKELKKTASPQKHSSDE